MNKKICACLILAFFCFSSFFPVALFADDTQQYMISGMVANKSDDSPLKDVEIHISGDKEFSEKTDVFGYYQIEGIDAGTYIEVAASKDGLEMSPDIFRISSLNSNRTINFAASSSSEQSGNSNKTKPASKQQSAVVVSPSGSQDVPVVAKPVSGVSQAQPTYVAETKPFFAAEPSSNSNTSSKSNNNTQQKTDAAPKAAFDLSGKVTYYASGLVGVRVMIDNDRRMMTTTDVNGYYSFKNLKSGHDYTVVFSRDGYMFDPAEYKIVDSGQDFIVNVEASASKYKIMGKIAEGKIGIEGVNVKIISGVDEFSTHTDRDGGYVVDGLAYGSNYFVTASKEGVIITPPKIIVNKLDNDRVVNFAGTQQKFLISGTVTDFDKEPLKNAEIEFVTTFDTYKAVTNSKGKYSVEDMPMALSYTLTANKDGYISSEQFVVESLDKNREINFQIKKENKKEKSSKASISVAAVEPVDVSAEKEVKKEAKDQEVKAGRKNRKQQKDEEPVAAKKEVTSVPVQEEKPKTGRNALREKADNKKKESSLAIVPKDEKSDKEREKEEKKLKAEQEKQAKIAEQKKAEQEEKNRKEKAEQEKLEEKQRVEDEKQAKIAQQQRAEQEKLEEKQRVEDEKQANIAEQKKVAEQEEKDRKERAEQKKLEEKQRVEDEKQANIAEQKKVAEQEKLEKEKKKEAEKQAKIEQEKLESEEQAKKEKTASSGPEKRKPKAKETAQVTAEAAVVKEEPVKTTSSKEKMVKVRGKIESKGEPLKDIEVRASSEFSTKTDEKGRYELSVPAGRRYVLEPRAADFNFEPKEFVYDELKTSAVQDFVPYITVEGEVFAEGKPVSNVAINVNGVQAAVTSQFGKYKIEKIDYGASVDISAVKNGVVFYPGSVDISKAVKNLENVNFMVSYSVSGRITVQGSGVGFGNANVEVADSANASVVTDFSGNFTILGLSQGGSFEIVPKAGGYSFTPPSRKFSDLRESFVGQNFLATKESYTVKGNVNIGGKPIRNAVVSISKRALKYYTDDEGNFNITNLDYGGPYTVSITSREHEFEPVVIDVLDKDTKVEFSTDISLGGTVVSGQKPLVGITVDVNGKKQKTDENGKYLVKGLKYNGDYLLSLSAPGVMFSPSQKEYTGVKKSVLNDVFNASALINGRVTVNGKALAGASVTISGSPAVYKSDSNGYFLIKDMQLGQDYTLEVASPGYKFDPPKREYKNLDSGKMAEHFKASVVVEGLSIKGIVSAEGRPLKKVAVVIEGTAKSQVFTDEDGQFIFEGLSANKKYELTVMSKTFIFESPSGIIENLDTDKEITLEPGRISSGRSIGEEPGSKAVPEPQAKTRYFKVSGKVTVDGNPLRNVSMVNKYGDVATNASGEYVITIEAGDSMEIRPSFPGYDFSPEKLTVRDIKAAASNMNFTARSNSHVLSGHILNKDLKGVKGISVKDVNSADDFMTDSKGSYKIMGLLHKTISTVVPDSEDYNFYPENIEISLENDLTANDIYAYPKKIKKAEAFIYGGIDSAVNIEENYISIVIVSAEGGRVSIKIKDNKGNAIKEFETNISENKASAIHWDGVTGTGADAPMGNYSVTLDGAGFRGEVLNFRVFE